MTYIIILLDLHARVILDLMGNRLVTVLLATSDVGASNAPLDIKEILLFPEICAFHLKSVILTAVSALTLIHILANAIARY